MSSNIEYKLALKADNSAIQATQEKLSGVSSALRSLVGIGAIALLQSQMRSAAAEGIRYNSKIEEIQRSLTAVTGSAGRAAFRLQELSSIEGKSRFGVSELAEASRQLQIMTDGALASGRGLQMVADVAAGTNSPLSATADALGRVYGQIQAGDQELGRGLQQLVMMGAINATVKNSVEALSKSGGSASQTWAALVAALQRYNGQAQASAETFKGIMFQFHQALEQALGAATRTIFGQAASGIKQLTTSLQDNGAASALQQLGAHLGVVISQFGPLFGMISNSRGLFNVLSGALAGLAAAFVSLKIRDAITSFASMVAGTRASTAAISSETSALQANTAARGANGAAGKAGIGSRLIGPTTGAGALNAASGALAVGLIGKGILDSYTAEYEAAQSAWEDLEENREKYLKGVRETLAALGSVAEKSEAIKNINERIAELQSKMTKSRYSSLEKGSMTTEIVQLETELRRAALTGPSDAELNQREARKLYQTRLSQDAPVFHDYEKRRADKTAEAEFENKIEAAEGYAEKLRIIQDELAKTKAAFENVATQKFVGDEGFQKQLVEKEALEDKRLALEKAKAGVGRDAQKESAEKSTRWDEYRLELQILNLRNAGNEAGATAAEKELAIRKKTAELLRDARGDEDKRLAPKRAQEFVDAEILANRPRPTGAALMPQTDQFARVGLFVGGVSNSIAQRGAAASERSAQILRSMYDFFRSSRPAIAGSTWQ